jgi:hypothetical protein
MTGPSWLADGLAGLMLLTAVYCVGRLVAARVQRRAAERDVDLVHVLMGVALAGMLVPRIGLRPAGLWTGLWAVAFAAAAGWFAWRAGLAWWLARRPVPPGGHHLPHLIMSGAMVYILLTAGHAAVSAPGAAVGGTGARFPLLAIILAQFMAGYVLWAADRLPALAPLRNWRSAAPPAAAPPAAIPGNLAALALSAVPAVPAGARAVQDAAAVTAGAGSAPDGPGAPPDVPDAAHRPPLSPRLAACCNIAMGLAMGYLLLVMAR